MQRIRLMLGCVLLLFCYCAVIQAASAADSTNSTLSIHFPGISSVHTEVRETDSLLNSATGKIIKKLRYKTDSASTELAHGTYDLVITKGQASLIIDDVQCNQASCSVNAPVATLTVNFPGLSSVHTSVRVSDGIQQDAEGGETNKANWKTDQAVIVLLQGTYDLFVRKGAASQVIDNVQCMTATCSVNLPVMTMTINFPGLKNVHNSIRIADALTHSASGDEVGKANWKTDQTQLLLFPGVYDIFARYGAASQIIDSVNCKSGDCQVGLPVSNLTVDFPGLSNVHTYVKNADGIDHSAIGEQTAKATWKKDQTNMLVFPGIYDLEIKHGKSAHILDNVNCENGDCLAKVPLANLSVNFPGLKSVHTYVKNSDGVTGTANGDQITKATSKTDKAELLLLPGIYDLEVKYGKSSYIIDDVNCESGGCQVNLPLANLTVDFPGLSKVHTYVKNTDGVDGTASGEQTAKATWKTDKAELLLLPGVYDLLIEFGGSSQVIDNVDCTATRCQVDLSKAELTVNFPGLKSIHTYVMKTDGQTNVASGDQITKAKWKTDQAQMTVLPGVYDLLIEYGSSQQIIDNVDCTKSKCQVDVPMIDLSVNFPGLSSVHTYVKSDDDQSNSASGEQIAKSTWKKESTEIKLFPGIYDLEIVRGAMTQIIDHVDCRARTCQADAIINTLKVNFEGMRSVHTSVRVTDNQDKVASGKEASKLNWQTDLAEIQVFPGIYDLLIRKGEASYIVDNVDCQTPATCIAEEITATLTAEFPGLQGVHTKILINDGVNGTATGAKVTHANYKKQNASLVAFRQIYDVQVEHQEISVFDAVDCTSGACSVLVEGNVQTTLINGDLNSAIADIRLTAYEKLADGSLEKVMQGVTNKNGKIHFSLAGITEGRIYVLKAHQPLNNRKSYFSAFITQEGPFKFIVSADGENELDLTQPELTISSPQHNGLVPHLGFEVTGFATDNRDIDRITVTINDPLKGESTLNANYTASSGRWNLQVDGSLISVDQTITLTATAFDDVQNQSSSSVNVLVVNDKDGPQISFTSHTDKDEVAVTGFLLSGLVTDQTGVEKLTVNLIDPVLGSTISNRDLEVSNLSGAWSLAVDNHLMTQGQTVTLNFIAIDISGNTSQRSLELNVVAVDFSASHLINRITFGATPQLLSEVESLGVQGYLSQQLNPSTIDDSTFNTMLTGLNPTTKEDLQAWTLMHMIHSKKQLQEVMTWFWDNHFNTNLNTRSMNAAGMKQSNTVSYELAENRAFRNNALGNFRTLLGISAKSPSMLIYLDSISNVAADSNENYTREVMELHTMGVDGGFTQDDVRAGAEIFTGWHLQNGNFFFNAAQHANAAHTLLGQQIPAGGIEQGEQFLDIIAEHQATAGHICNKLITLLVNDNPPTSLLIRCANKFLQRSEDTDQIAQVLDLILQSAEFYEQTNYRAKIKTPVEFVVGAVRNLEADTNASDLIGPIASMGIRLYENPVPTGWPEIGEDWINASLLVERIKWVNRLTRELPDGNNTTIDPLAFYPQYGFETAEGIVGFLIKLTLDNDVTDVAKQQAFDILGPSGIDLTDPGASDRLRQLSGSVLSFPQYQFQ